MPSKKQQNLVLRPPVVVILGHVDHGKTSILDYIRKSHVAEKESGGITQHIGTYQAVKDNRKITFIDTPGHEAFFQMRSRGAKVADIAVLVVDASEGIKPQTKEAILHAKNSNVPLIVALNKIDKPEADPERIKGELAKEGVLTESMGGKVPSVKVSAKTGQGIDELLDLILLMADMEELKADLEGEVSGVVIESYLDSLRGATATLLLVKGILKSGDIIGTASAFGKVKGLKSTAMPSDSVVVFGLSKVPQVGEEFKVFPDLESAQKLQSQPQAKEAEMPEESKEGKNVLNLILKTDVFGSAQAIEDILKNLPQDQVLLKILKSEPGNISESDVKLARISRAWIIGFRVKTEPSAANIVERERVRVMNFDIIYELIEAVRKLLEKMVKPEERVRRDLGQMKVLAVFFTEKSRQIVGGKITEGEVRKGSLAEVMRHEEKVGQGRVVNLQRNKKDAESVQKGDECGIFFDGNIKVEEGDALLFYQNG